MGKKSISNSFVVNTIEESVVYTLVPSQSVVAKTSGGSPKNTTLSFRVMKSVGETTAEVTGWLAENLRLAHIVNRSEQNDGSTSGSSLSVDIASLYSSNSNVQWLLYHGTDIVHRMYIGSSNDGGNGVSPTVYSIDVTPPSVSIPAIADSTTFTATASFYKTIGNSRSAASVYWAVYVRNNAGSMRLVAGGTTTAATSASLGFSVSRSDAAIEVYINTTATVGSWVAKSVIDIAKEGKRGRFYYYAGDWPEVIPLGDTTTFEVTDQRAPFFRRIDREMGKDGKVIEVTTYWQFIGANGNYTYSQMGRPTKTNANFEMMVNDFSYLISEAVFANFAKFGSAIISGYWMLSSIGTRGGVESTQYEYFDGNYPDCSNADGTNFIPKYAVNLRDGQIYGVEFQTAVANGMYAKMSATAIGMYNALTGNPCVMFGVDSGGSPYIDMYNKDGIIAWRWDYRGFKSWIGDVIPRSWGELILAPIERGNSYIYLYRAANNRNNPEYGWESWYRFSGQGKIEDGVFVLSLGNDTTYNEKITSDSTKPTLNPNDIPNVFGDDKTIPDGYYLLWKYDHGIDSVSINGKTLEYLTYVRVADGKIEGEYLIHYLVGPSGATPYKADGSGPLDDDIGEHPWD